MKRVYVFLMFCFCLTIVFSQSVERYTISSYGGTCYFASNFEMDFTLGDVIVSTYSNASNSLTQGYQQPFSIDNVTPEEPNSITIFPNPFVDQINIQITGYKAADFDFMIYNLLGQLVLTKNYKTSMKGSTIINIDLWTFAAGNYFLRVIQNGSVFKTYKLMKMY